MSLKRREKDSKTIRVNGESFDEGERRIIRVGNSEGLTLAPSWLRFLFGVRETLGQRINCTIVRDYRGQRVLVITPLKDEDEGEEEEEP